MKEKGIEYKNKAVERKDEFEHLLTQVIDTEIGLDIVNLGLIYEVDLSEDGHCRIRLTFTSAGCPCAAEILNGIHAQLDPQAWIEELEILVVWDPAWTLDRISRVGRISLGINPGR